MQLDMAVRAVQSDYGDYPPDFSDWSTPGTLSANSDSPAVDRWLLRAFPRYTVTSGKTPSWQMVNDIQNYYFNASTSGTVANPASALVVFLGGVPAVAGSSSTGWYNNYSVQNPTGGIPWRSDGFNADPTSPFSPGLPRIKAKFEFPNNRVDTSTGSPYFVPPGVASAGPNAIPAPYVYFHAGLDQTTGNPTSGSWCYNYYYNGTKYVLQQFVLPSADANSPPGANTDYAVPYQKVVPSGNSPIVNPPWRNNDTFQIISSGLDGLYGNLATRVSGTVMVNNTPALSLPDFDNVTNFIQNGSTLENELTK
jgi:hypothetical protein